MAKFGNKEMQNHYNSTRGNPADKMSAKSEPKGDTEQEPDGDEQPIEEAVSEHGPAEHIEMHTHHEDGHVHKSKHHDHQSAHDHVSKAFGEQAQEPMPAAEPMPQHSSIPTLG